MSFADLFARYRAMGAMEPQPLDEHLFSAGSDWNCTMDDYSQDAPLQDGDGVRQDRKSFKPSRPFVLTTEGDYVRVSSDEGLEELFSPPPRLGLNLGLLKNNSVCKDYYRLTSSVLKSLLMGIKEMATEEITPAWQVGFPCSSPKKSLSSLFARKLNEDVSYPKLTTMHSGDEIGTSKLSSFSHNSKLPMREVVNIDDLRRWFWGQVGHPQTYLGSTTPTNELNGTEAELGTELESSSSLQSPSIDTSEDKSFEVETQSQQTQFSGLEQVTSSTSEGKSFEEDSMVESPDFQTNTSESPETKVTTETSIESSSQQSSLGTPAEDNEVSTRHCTGSDSDHESLLRKNHAANQASRSRQCISTRRREEKEHSRSLSEVNCRSVSSKEYGPPADSKHRIIEREVSSSRPRKQVVARNNEAMNPPRPKSWCLVGGYVKRFPTKHHTSGKSQSPANSQPQVPLAA
ncbi:hypothetical protein MPTK1_1g04770 [Marchantia polymorpha subsp. ruderalis]|uniref:Uncharacterized protein n=2 Tax=Marchantia polymorpha TaxID=3197 RepID=A0AAF6ALJ7_MARPO|nr:hypothetical protein MARPO_0005s0131 [Marchantia polymorpha]BBM97317.1 hypothetical protein Mp_1g04770 [Marchantia polymorpha subsp. ruderalis]|eukprot:PTQ48490.1 hypothetical protein MARPO_0005s0131 [Marchantia polymorpha]